MLGKKKETEVFMISDLELYTIIYQVLKATQIPCEVKIVNTDTQNRRTGTLMDRVGERFELKIQYYIYTFRGYAERTKYMIDEYKKSLSR